MPSRPLYLSTSRYRPTVAARYPALRLERLSFDPAKARPLNLKAPYWGSLIPWVRDPIFIRSLTLAVGIAKMLRAKFALYRGPRPSPSRGPKQKPSRRLGLLPSTDRRMGLPKAKTR
jgi:hypothetical protein